MQTSKDFDTMAVLTANINLVENHSTQNKRTTSDICQNGLFTSFALSINKGRVNEKLGEYATKAGNT